MCTPKEKSAATIMNMHKHACIFIYQCEPMYWYMVKFGLKSFVCALCSKISHPWTFIYNISKSTVNFWERMKCYCMFKQLSIIMTLFVSGKTSCAFDSVVLQKSVDQINKRQLGFMSKNIPCRYSFLNWTKAD